MQAAPDPKVLEHESADQAEQKVVQQVMDANGDGQLNLGDADDKLIEQLIRQVCPTASRTNIENIRNTIKKRVELAKQQGGGLRIVDEKAQSLNERANTPDKELDKGPRTRNL